MFCMAEAPAVNTPTEKPWREMSLQELAIRNLNFEIEKTNGQINLANPNASISPRPDRPADVTSGTDINDYESALTEHRQDQFEAARFDEENEGRIRHLRLTLDSLEDDKSVVESGGKNQSDLIEQYAEAEKKRMEQLEKSKKQPK